MNKVISLLLIALSVWAAPYKVAQKVMPLDLKDQFDKHIVLKTMPSTIVMAFEKGTSATVNDCLGKQNGAYLSEHKAAFVADISPMPTFIAEAFALPKMRKYPYTVLLIRDEEVGLKFPSQEGKITVLRLEGNVIKAIEYVTTADELKTAIEK
jgi:hypothetical protein